MQSAIFHTMYPSNNLIGDLVRSQLPDYLAQVVNSVLAIVAILLLVGLTPVLLIWLERKVAARFQARLGPMRVGWHGTLQPFADGIKLMFKEVLKPGMICTVGPGIYLPDWGGIRLENQVVVTETGVEVLTQLPIGDFLV